MFSAMLAQTDTVFSPLASWFMKYFTSPDVTINTTYIRKKMEYNSHVKGSALTSIIEASLPRTGEGEVVG